MARVLPMVTVVLRDFVRIWPLSSPPHRPPATRKSAHRSALLGCIGLLLPDCVMHCSYPWLSYENSILYYYGALPNNLPVHKNCIQTCTMYYTERFSENKLSMSMSMSMSSLFILCPQLINCLGH